MKDVDGTDEVQTSDNAVGLYNRKVGVRFKLHENR